MCKTTKDENVQQTNVHSHCSTKMRLRICNTSCGWFKRHHSTVQMLPCENKWCLENTLGVSLQMFPGCANLYHTAVQWKVTELTVPEEKHWSVNEFTLQGLPCTAQCCSLPSISHPDSSQAAVPVWWAASALCPYSSSRCPLCRGCAGVYILSLSLGSGISRSAPVSEPGGPRWRSSHSSPIPSPGRCFDGCARACRTRARLARAEGPLGWCRLGQTGRPPPPRGRPATGRGPRKCRGNQLHIGASAGDSGLRGEADDCLLLY